MVGFNIVHLLHSPILSHFRRAKNRELSFDVTCPDISNNHSIFYIYRIFSWEVVLDWSFWWFYYNYSVNFQKLTMNACENKWISADPKKLQHNISKIYNESCKVYAILLQLFLSHLIRFTWGGFGQRQPPKVFCKKEC